MSRRAAWWQSIPLELRVPVALAAMLDIASQLIPLESGGDAASSATSVCRDLLVLYGMLEVRRRIDRRGSWLLAGAVIQGVMVANQVASRFLPSVLGRGEMRTYFTASSILSLITAMCFASAMLTAARAWRSWLAPIAIVAVLVSRSPLGAVIWMTLQIEEAAVRALMLVATLLAQLALLAIYRRLSVAAAPPSDPGRAERGARRAARSLRAGALAMSAYGIAVGVVIAWDAHDWFVPVTAVFGAAALVAVMCQMSGVLGMAAAGVANLSPGELSVAAFGALWQGLLTTGARFAGFASPGTMVPIAALLVGLVFIVIGTNAMRTLAVQRGDTELDRAIGIRVTTVVLLQLASAGALLMLTASSVPWLMALSYLVFQVSAMVVLGSAYARVAQRMQMVAAVDVF